MQKKVKKSIIQIVVASAALSLAVSGMDFIQMTGTFEPVWELKVAAWLVFGAAMVWKLGRLYFECKDGRLFFDEVDGD